MRDSKENAKDEHNYRVVKNPTTGLPLLSSPSITKEDINQDFLKGEGLSEPFL